MKIYFKTIVIISCLFFLPTITLAVNSTGYGFGENIGWVNFNSTDAGVTVSAAGVTGYLWLENAGWVYLIMMAQQEQKTPLPQIGEWLMMAQET